MRVGAGERRDVDDVTAAALLHQVDSFAATVETAERLDSVCEERFHLSFVADVTHKADAATAAELIQLRRRLGDLVFMARADRNTRTDGDQRAGDGVADALRSAGDDCRFVCQ